MDANKPQLRGGLDKVIAIAQHMLLRNTCCCARKSHQTAILFVCVDVCVYVCVCGCGFGWRIAMPVAVAVGVGVGVGVGLGVSLGVGLCVGVGVGVGVGARVHLCVDVSICDAASPPFACERCDMAKGSV